MSLLSRLSSMVRPRPPLPAPPEPAPSPGRVPLERRGSPGTPWSGWRPGVETAPELQGRAWPRTAREMLRTDAKLAGIQSILTQALLSARWEVVPGDSSEEARRNAEHVRQALGLEGRPARLRSGSFEAELERMLWYLPVGFRVLEELWRVEGGQVWLDGWADTEPESVQEWRRGPDGSLAYIVQAHVPGQPAPAPIPAHKALVLTRAQTGDDYTGTGILRPCWKWWRLKRHVMDQLGVGAERWATPTPVVGFDRDLLKERLYPEEAIRELVAEAYDAARAYVAHGEAALQLPTGVTMSTYGEGAYDPAGLLSVIDHANQELATAYVAHFIELGLGDVGSRATGQVHWNSWRQAVSNILDHVAGVLASTTIARLVGYNFYAPDGCEDAANRVPHGKRPSLRHVGLEVDGLADALGTLPSLVGAGILSPDDSLERGVRRLVGLRDRPGPRREWDERLGSSVLGQAADAGGGEGRPTEGPAEVV